MALGQSDISVTLVKNTLGEGSTAVSALCTSNLINKWSRCKPVNGTFPSASDGKFGLSLSDWSYTKPTSVFRLGDFRGYEHSGILPPIYSPTVNNNVPSILYPSGTINAATFSFKANATNNTTRIKPVDLGIASYYIGIRYRVNSGFWYYLTDAQVSSLSETTGQPINIDVTVTVSGGVGTFANAPVNTVGTVDVQLLICNTQCVNWTTTAPTIVYLLPSEVVAGITVVNSFSFTIAGWLVLSNLSMYWTNSAYGSANYQSSIVATSGDNWTIGDKPSWLTVDVYRSGNKVNSGGYITGDELRIYPSAGNTGASRADYVNIGAKSIYVTMQGGAPTWSFSYTGFTGASGSITLTPGATSAYMQFTVSSGLGSTNRTVWFRLYNNTTGAYVGSWQSVSTRDGQIVTNTLTGLSTSDIAYGSAYTVSVTTTDPNQ